MHSTYQNHGIVETTRGWFWKATSFDGVYSRYNQVLIWMCYYLKSGLSTWAYHTSLPTTSYIRRNIVGSRVLQSVLFLELLAWLPKFWSWYYLNLEMWCGDQTKKASNLHRKRTSFCWVIESLYEFVLNLSSSIRAIYTANITQCYEKLSLEGIENLHDSLNFIIRKGFYHHNGSSKK